VSWLACFAVAMHSILLGVPQAATGAPVDPFSVICHSEAPAASPSEQTPASPVSAPTHACDHCNLCSAMAPPDALDAVLAGQLTPAKLLQVLRPATAATRAGIANNPNRTRGPPSFA